MSVLREKSLCEVRLLPPVLEGKSQRLVGDKCPSLVPERVSYGAKVGIEVSPMGVARARRSKALVR
jgi:hypothetical protein